MPSRKPQINFQVEPNMKLVYDEAKACGHRVSRWCAAGLLMLVQDGALRQDAINRLRDWEDRFVGASPEAIRAYVRNAGRRKDCGR